MVWTSALSSNEAAEDAKEPVMSSDVSRERAGLRKLIAQVGVIIFIIQMLAWTFGPVLFYLLGDFSLPAFLYLQSGIFVLLIAALLPTNPKEEWGSMAPRRIR
jgi:hypothetical protein